MRIDDRLANISVAMVRPGFAWNPESLAGYSIAVPQARPQLQLVHVAPTRVAP